MVEFLDPSTLVGAYSTTQDQVNYSQGQLTEIIGADPRRVLLAMTFSANVRVWPEVNTGSNGLFVGGFDGFGSELGGWILINARDWPFLISTAWFASGETVAGACKFKSVSFDPSFIEPPDGD